MSEKQQTIRELFENAAFEVGGHYEEDTKDDFDAIMDEATQAIESLIAERLIKECEDIKYACLDTRYKIPLAEELKSRIERYERIAKSKHAPIDTDEPTAVRQS